MDNAWVGQEIRRAHQFCRSRSPQTTHHSCSRELASVFVGLGVDQRATVAMIRYTIQATDPIGPLGFEFSATDAVGNTAHQTQLNTGVSLGKRALVFSCLLLRFCDLVCFPGVQWRSYRCHRHHPSPHTLANRFRSQCLAVGNSLHSHHHNCV
jgi:hypothetical protein